MKKIFLCAAIAVLGLTSVNAQGEPKVGVNAGLVVGDFSDGYSFNLALDVAYLWGLSDQIEAGATVGYSHSFGKDVEGFKVDDASFLPLAASGRFNVSEEFAFGVDLGYAVGIDEGNDGGFYYAPRIQYGVSDNLDIVAAYRGVSMDAGPVTLGFNTITLGVEFEL
ncbi:outer membrane beta-barrel protein [Snuella sedimenti]|uniref:Outer membrane beta-barrel protein n=1 Tax=Snuella sedimenti TaxID=2798802 RepID=A0A8J7LPD4_9FLAO|nr:outer membrane beta-barrel protein [Snuella sedimenti]MBJ6369193.1 outer membrane beta-barrel protein [Snuella sedimenti]